jgi:hypothetical protein
MSRIEPGIEVPIRRFLNELSGAVLASAQGQFDEAQQHLATLTSIVRDHAIPRGEGACLIGFAKVALDRGDYARASRLQAAVSSSAGAGGRPLDSRWPGCGSLLDALIYARCSEVLRDVLDPETARTTQAEGSALSLRQALDAELIRGGAAAMARPAD